MEFEPYGVIKIFTFIHNISLSFLYENLSFYFMNFRKPG